MKTTFRKNYITITVSFDEEELSVIEYCVRLKQFEDTRAELIRLGWEEDVMLLQEQAI